MDDKPHILISPEAATHLQEEVGNRLLRIAFTTGCGGSGYRLSYADTPNDGDIMLDLGVVKVALDDMAASRLDGATINYDDVEEGYLLDHPDAVTAVWCG
jgi:Fe-S cluster assembly iron-binding protein IscA